jgi:hypothetical protein
MTHIKELSIEELSAEHAAVLPEREALALINIAPVTGVNLSIAVNAASFGSAANAIAGQMIGVAQS